jgi:hypothetical protein
MRNGNFEAMYRLNVAMAELAKAIGALGSASSELYPGGSKK